MQLYNSYSCFFFNLNELKLYLYLFTNQMSTSATNLKLGDLKFSIDMRREYPKARIISVKSVKIFRKY